ncbi:MAG: DUF2341 domain-containing protein [Patescibacteria group bacterium]
MHRNKYFILTKFKNITKKRVLIAKWEMNLIIIVAIFIGIILGVYITLSGLLPKVFATSQGAITFNSSTQFQSGTLSQTQVVGSGTPSNVALTGGSGPDGTKYVAPITINNSGNSNALTNYQVLVTVNTASLITSGELLSDCRDLRFRDSNQTTNLTNYWIENCNNTATKIWVQVPSIQASSTKTIYMYYGGSSTDVAQSSITNTFLGEISGLIGDWPMNESSGQTIYDYSGNSNTGTAYGTTIVPGKFGNARNLNGTNSNYIEAPIGTYFGGNNPLTASAWVDVTSTTNGPIVGITQSNPPGNWNMPFLSINGTTIYGWLWGVNGNIPLSYTTTLGWHYLTITYTPSGSGEEILYVDGVAVKSGTGQYAPSGAYDYWSTYIPGAKPGGVNSYLTGIIEDVSVYSQVLSQSQISNIYNNYGYATLNYPGYILVRQYSSPEPTTTVGSGGTAVSLSGAWSSATTGSNVINTIWNGGWGNGTTSTSTAFSATVGSVTSSQTITFQIRAATTVSGLSTATYYTIGTASSGTTFQATMSQLDYLGVPADQYVQVSAEFSQNTGISPTLSSFTVYYAQDNTPPSPNASAIVMSNTGSGGYNIATGGWDNSAGPYFSWTPGADSQSGIKGYCLYIGTDSSGNPATTKGLLGTSPLLTTGSTCQFITSSTSIDLSQIAYQGSTWLTSSTSPYYFSISAIDNNNNVDATPVTFSFYYDGTPPVNVSYISCAGGSFSNVQNMTFSWPTAGSNTSSDSYSGLLGWQYQINSSTGTWEGTTTDSTLGGIPYIPATQSSLNLPKADSSNIVVGSNVIYFRTVNIAGGVSTPSTYRTCSINYGGAAPTFATNIGVTINPTTSTTNYYSLSWPTATAATGKSVTDYYYMINTQPPQTLATMQNNPGEYINNGNSTSVATISFANVRRGVNTVYAVAIDNSSPPDYSPSNYISGTFTLNSTNPDPVGNLIATDSSIKAQKKWNVALSWTAPTYQGAGNLQYLIYRSSNNVDFTKVGATIGLSYIDNTPQSALYYYYVLVEDGAGAFSSNSYTVSITPTGRYTTPPILEGGPNISNLTDQSATISWSTNRNGDSKIQYGLSPTNFYQTEPSVPTQATYHSVTLTSLSPGTTYYYKALWTDTDGNTGTSYESSFTTNPPPEVSNVHATNVSLYSGYVTFSISNAVQATIEYGPTPSYGGTVSIATSPATSTYSVPLTNLSSGTSYNYRIVMQDSSGNIFYSDNYADLVTLPAPKITNVRLAQVRDTVIPTVMVTWDSNTPISSIITYWPSGNTAETQNKINITLQKGTHQIFLQGLNSKTTYNLVVKGVDKMGNEASSYTQTFTTATNTMPPLVTGLNVQGEVSRASSSNDQLVVSWTTDTPSTSQVEFGVGAGSSYPQKTQESTHLVLNHLVVISNLIPSQVYHLKVVSIDQSGNIGYSIDTVTITPKANQSALTLVLTNLGQAFGFLGGL